ncbi:terminase large subunit [Stenotrophomonas virus Jojan60]|nr:terminase large subunit [Stenotrophomonas virus Jojan60]
MGATLNILPGAIEKVVEERERAIRTEGYHDDPVAWAKYMLGATLWSKQREIANDIVHHKNVAVKAGHGVGKSYLISVLICWWVDTRYPDVFVASTAPSVSQIGAIVWREIRKIYSLVERRYNEGLIDHKLPGSINKDTKDNQWKTDDGQLIGFGRKPPDEKADDAFQGIHDAAVLALGDEATGLSEEIIDALSNITSNEDSRRVLIANPTNPASYFAKIFRDQSVASAWKLHTISVFDSPNFTDEKYEMPADALKKLTGPEYAEDKKKEYGENSARYKARVLGEFAFDVGDSLIQPEDIAVALDAHVEPSTETRPELGVDVAAYGEDFSVVYENWGGRLRFVESWDQANAMQTASHVHRLALERGAWRVRIDAGGFGGAVADLVVDMADGRYQVVRMFGQAASPDKRQWVNARAYWWDKFRMDCRKGRIDIDPNEEKAETLQDELMSVEYKYGTSGGIQIESKEDMRRRGFKSPDYADAAVYASADLSWLDNNPLASVPNGTEMRLNMDDFEESWATALPW